MKHIKELLLTVVSMEGEDGDLLPSLHTQQDIEKFAELIIQECADYIEHFYGDFVAKEIGGDIKRHFGVE